MPLASQKRVGGSPDCVAIGHTLAKTPYRSIGRHPTEASVGTLPKTRHKKSRLPELIQAFGCACRYASGS